MRQFRFSEKWVLWACSVLFAFFLWMAVALTVDTAAVVDFKVPVNIESMQAALSSIELRPVVDKYVTNVKLSGSRRVLGELDIKSDLEVCADVSQVVSAGEYTLNLYCNVLNGGEIKVVSIHPKAITVKFDKLITKKFAIELDIEGVTVPENYIMTQPSLASADIAITGPETELMEIEHCRLSFDSKKMVLKGTTTLSGKVKLLRGDNTLVESKNIFCSYSKMDVTIPVFKIKEVPLRFGFINQPDSLDSSKLNFKPEISTIKIGCDPQVYDAISEIFLGYVDFSKLSANDKLAVFNIESVLSSNILNVSGIKEVKIMLEENLTEKTFSTSKIELVNKPEGRKTKILTERIYDVRLVGKQESIDKLQGSNLVAIVDLQDLKEKKGRMAIPVRMLIPNFDDVWVLGSYEVYLSID